MWCIKNLHDVYTVSVYLYFSTVTNMPFFFIQHLLTKHYYTSNTCLVPTQLTKVIRPYPSENDVQLNGNLSAAGPSLMYASGLSSIVRWQME